MARYIISLLAVVCTTSLLACKDDTCRQMKACCDASSQLSGIGDACEKLTSGPQDPATCHTVLTTLEYMHEDQKAELPEVCRLKK